MSRPFIPVPNTCSVELIYTAQNQILENVLHVKGSAPFSGADVTALRTLINTWDGASWNAIRCSAVSLTRIRTKALDSLGSPMEDYSLPAARPGVIGSALCPLSATFAIKLATGLTGRSYRGRIYVPGIGITEAANSYWAAAKADMAVAAVNTLITTLRAHSPVWELCVVSYRGDKAWRAEGIATPVSQALYTDLAIDNQRRRLPGRGRS